MVNGSKPNGYRLQAIGCTGKSIGRSGTVKSLITMIRGQVQNLFYLGKILIFFFGKIKNETYCRL